MKRLLLLVSFLLLTAIAGTAQAQLRAPEFLMRFTLKEGTATLQNRGIGFDPAATDSYDTIFKRRDASQPHPFDTIFIEDYDYPGSTGFIPDFFFEYAPDPNHAFTRTDIRKKPSDEAFSIQYTMDLSITDFPAILTWDRSQIPSQVRAILVTPFRDSSRVLVDLLKTNTDTIRTLNDKFAWQRTSITLFYNMDPTFSGTSGVRESGPSASLIANLGAYPNPMLSNGALNYELSESARVHVTVYDVSGHKCLDMTTAGSVGPNRVDLTNLGPAHGALLVHVEAISASRQEVKNVMVMKN